MNLNKSITDVEKILSEHKSLQDYIDKTGEIFVFASTLLAILIAPSPVAAIAALGLGTDILSFKFSKLFDWLPEKLNYHNKGKEEIVVQRYEKAMLVNMIIFHIAIQAGVKKILPAYVKDYEKAIKKLYSKKPDEKKEKIEQNKTRLTEEGKRLDEKIRKHTLEFNDNFKNCASPYVQQICMPFISELIDKSAIVDKVDPSKRDQEKNDLIKKLEREIYIDYNAYLVHLSVEFPEFARWVDLEQKENILQSQKELLRELGKLESKYPNYEELQKEFNGQLIEIQKNFIERTEKTLIEIKKIKDYSFEKSFGFETLIENQAFVSRQLSELSVLYKEEKLANIEAHHNQIRHKLEERLVDNEDIEGIVYPKNKEIFVPQSFKVISYQRTKHQKQFLLDSFWDREEPTKGEDVGKFIMNELYYPENSFKPIIILGNPGAGKSMLSSILAARLCESNEFVPFFIRLREVVLSDTNPKNHINDGIKHSIEGNIEVDWISWAKEFKTRIPVIVLDGFDELLRASQAEINNYVTRISGLLENAYRDYGIAARVILTSRLTVMQDVEIPNETTIIRLDSFDDKRQNQWIEQWNSFQNKADFAKFKLTNNNSIKELAKEPLLLFMLAVYDFENSDLQNDVDQQDFNQSKLYDKLFNKFTIRQLDKESEYGGLSPSKKEKLAKKFRLRLGAISTLMFLNDIDYKETQKLSDELNAFGVGGEDAQPNLIFKGFFFIHKDKSTGMAGQQLYTFEFIHKSFGEFLTADFLLRVILERTQNDDVIEKMQRDDCMRFCWGYNWLHKHFNTTRFLFEYANQLIPKDSPSQPIIINLIKSELKNVFGTKINLFPISDLSLIDSKPVLEHLAIYSQNLILLWVALEKMKVFPFNLFGIGDNHPFEFKFENQDRTEIDKNKGFWKRITKLWELYGNKNAIAKLKEWVDINESEESISLYFRTGEIIHNFSDSTQISCNDYELLLSFTDNPLSIKELYSIVKRKKELLAVGVKIINDKFDVFFLEDEGYLLETSIEFIQSDSTPISEMVRLLENLNLYFPHSNSHRFFREAWKGERLRHIIPKILTTSSGNLPYWIYHQFDHPQENLIDAISIEDFENMGLNRSLKFIENYRKYGFRGLRNPDFSRLIGSKVHQFVEFGTDHQLAEYLSNFYRIPKRIRIGEPIIEPELIRFAFEKSLGRIFTNPNFSFFTYQYLKSFMLSKIYFDNINSRKSEFDSHQILPNKAIERIYYENKAPIEEFRKHRNFHLFVDYFELLIIALKSRAIGIREDFESIEDLCQSSFDFFEKERNLRYNLHWEMPKFFDLLTILTTMRKGDNKYRFFLFKFIEIYWEQQTERGRSLSYEDHLKLLKIMVNYQDELNPRLLEDCFNQLYETSRKLINFNSRMKLQFAMLLNNSIIGGSYPNWHVVSDSINQYKRRGLGDVRGDLDFLRNYEHELFHEFNNEFYYEINRSDNFPYFFLRRSILHGDEERDR